MMGAFGRFLEIGLPAADVLASLRFYRELGFRELTTGDIRRWHYAVVTDGSIAIGLHGAGIDEPALAFVRPNLAPQVTALVALGHEFEFRRLGAEEFNEAGLRGPDGHLILMMEARTFSPGPAAPGATLIGRCAEVALGCGDVDVTRRFFEAAGFLPAEDTGAERLTTPGLTLALTDALRPGSQELRFQVDDPAAVAGALGQRDMVVKRERGRLVLRSPEGTRLVIG